MSKPLGILVGFMLLLIVTHSGALAQVDPRIAVVTTDGTQGNCDAIDIDPPWAVLQNLESLGPHSRVRFFFNRLYAVSPANDEILVIDPELFDMITTLEFDSGASPEDILVISPNRAFVTLYNSTDLAIVDPRDGTSCGAVDLSGFADHDGLPEMSMMASDGDRLFIQIQRLDRSGSGNLVPPSYLAVLDLESETLIDVDPDQSGVQGIELLGTNPSFRMQVDSRLRRLFVSTPGRRLSTSGGIEEIDLSALQSLGFILSESDAGADLGGFVMVSVDEGYVLAHTDFIASSHLHSFSRTGGQGAQITTTFNVIDSMALDRITSQLFFPDPFSTPSGVHVIDTHTNTVLTSAPLATGLPPWDLAVVRRTTPGDARNIQVHSLDSLTGELSFDYRPACGASDHNIVYGPLEDVQTYGYSGQVCGIGSSGEVEAFDPGEGSYFFMVVGTGDAGDEGSYGVSSINIERPEDLTDPVCVFTQDLTFSCAR
jgi:hypothetical protein